MTRSADDWTFHPDNPVIAPGEIGGDVDARIAGAGSVVRADDCFRMYYWGSGSRGDCICLAEADADAPTEWRFVDVVLEARPGVPWMSGGARWPWALRLDDETVFLYFCGRGDTAAHPYPNHICLAVSDDGGRAFDLVDHPLMKREKAYEAEAFGSFCVVRDDDEMRMYYTAMSGHVAPPEGEEGFSGKEEPLIGIGYAVSDDGLRWRRPFDSWMIPPRLLANQRFEVKVARPCVVRDGERRRMWVSCLGDRYYVEELESDDGLHWTWLPSGRDGALGVGADGDFDDVQRSYASVLRDDTGLHCWYTGNGFGAAGTGYARRREEDA